MNICILILIHLPLVIITFFLFFYGKSLLGKNLTKKESIIKEGVSIPFFEFNISQSTIGLILIILSLGILVFTTNSILKNINNIDFINKIYTIDANISKNIEKLKKKQILIQNSQIEISKSILKLNHKHKDENATK